MSAHPLEELWLDLVDGTLPEGEVAALRAHVASCDRCRALLAQLEDAHAPSIHTGRAAGDEAPPGPPAEAAVLRGAREAAAPAAPELPAPRSLGEERELRARRRSRRMALFGVTGLTALAAAALFALLPSRPEDGMAWMRESLGALAPAGAIRGADDPVADGAARAQQAWSAGALTAKTSVLPCSRGTLSMVGLVDAGGRLSVYALRHGDRTDVHVYAPDGAEVGSARLVAGVRADFVLPPLSQRHAREQLEADRCFAVP